MTDNEIIQALECCIQSVSLNDCEDLQCPACDEIGCLFMRKSTEYYPESLIQEMGKAVLDLINHLKAQNKEFDEKIIMQMGLIEHQKAEIERLKVELDGETVKNMRLGHEVERLQAGNTDLKKAIETMTNEHIKWGFEAKKRIENAKSEAYKELAEIVVSDYPETDYYLEKILKELTEGGNEDGVD